MAYSNGQVTVGTAPTKVAVVPQENAGALVSNTGSVDVYLGGPSVAASGANQGALLAASATLTVPSSGSEDNTLYAVVGTGTSTVTFLVAGSAE